MGPLRRPRGCGGGSSGPHPKHKPLVKFHDPRLLDRLPIWRGGARTFERKKHARTLPDARPASATAARYVELFNQRDWDGLRALLADDVKLHQSLHPLRIGRADAVLTASSRIDISKGPGWAESAISSAAGSTRAAVGSSRIQQPLGISIWAALCVPKGPCHDNGSASRFGG